MINQEEQEIIEKLKAQRANVRPSRALLTSILAQLPPASSANEADSARQEPDLILDFGRLPKKPVSTIIRVKNKKIEIIRQGGIKI